MRASLLILRHALTAALRFRGLAFVFLCEFVDRVFGA